MRKINFTAVCLLLFALGMATTIRVVAKPTQQQQQTHNLSGLQSPNRLLTENDLRGLSKSQLRIMRNEIFARHGYIFDSKDLREYFSQQSWYKPQSKDVTHLLSDIDKKNVEFIKKYEASDSSGNKNNSGSSNQIQPPPIVNAKGWNAMIQLPENWNGKSMLANGFILIDLEDKKLQNKYNVHPGHRSPKDGHIYFDEDDCANDACWREIWDDDENFYEYPLSPNVIIEAGLYDEGNNLQSRKMTVSAFADYYKKIYKCDENSCFGMLSNVTYQNGMITRIVEQYTP
jgi:hypothetical protein